MSESARRARKKRMAEEALQTRESQCNGKPLDLSGPDSGRRLKRIRRSHSRCDPGHPRSR